MIPNIMSKTYPTEKEWLGKLYRKSESQNTVYSTKSSLSLFDIYCEYKKTTRKQLIDNLKFLRKK